MNLVKALELSKEYADCPKCSNNKLGNGQGSMVIDDFSFKRLCRCGWSIEIKEEN